MLTSLYRFHFVFHVLLMSFWIPNDSEISLDPKSLPVIQVGDRWAVVTAGERAWTPWSHVTWYVISHGEVLEAVMQMPTACFTQESARWQRWHRPILEPFGWTQPEARYHWSVSKLQCLGIMGLGIQRYFRVNWNAKRYKDVNTLLLMF